MTSNAAQCYEAAARSKRVRGSAIDEHSRTEKEQKIRGIYQTVSVASVGIEMGLSVVVGWAIGYWLDTQFDSEPYLMLVFLLVGTAAGFRGLIRAAKQARPEPESKPPPAASND